MRLVLAVMALSALGYCKDETVTGHGGAEKVWHLESLDGAVFGARHAHVSGRGGIAG